MKSRTLLVAIVLAQIALLTGCRKEIEKKPAIESTGRRLEYERKIKLVAREIPFIVSIRSGSGVNSALVTGFFVDSRGYIVTARHAYSEPMHNARIEMFSEDGRITPLRIVGEIQTLDMAVLATDTPVAFPVATFGDILKIMKRGKYYGGSFWEEWLGLEKRMVAVRCVNKDGTPGLDRIMIGELSRWEEYGPEISFTQLQQDLRGCSGAPIVNMSGEVLGMLTSAVGDSAHGVDAPSVSEGAQLLIEEDLKKRPQ